MPPAPAQEGPSTHPEKFSFAALLGDPPNDSEDEDEDEDEDTNEGKGEVKGGCAAALDGHDGSGGSGSSTVGDEPLDLSVGVEFVEIPVFPRDLPKKVLAAEMAGRRQPPPPTLLGDPFLAWDRLLGRHQA